MLWQGVSQELITATTEVAKAVEETDITFVSVGTPTSDDGGCDYRYVISAAQEIGKGLAAKSDYHIVVMRCSIPPATTLKVMVPEIEKVSGLKMGRDFGVCFNPEFLREGTAVEDFNEPPKTVIGAKAYAKISMRLVPHQDWKKITELFTQHFQNIAPKGVTVKVTPHHGGQAYVTPVNSTGYKAASKAYEKTFGSTPIPQRDGGSIPIVALFEKELSSKTILMGFGLDSDAIHSPNEHFGVFNFLKGIETIPWFYKYFTELST